ncbi:MAG: hypothetical protein CBARDCOR_2219 [uncultured Caballeronia sp.]|nr:MAG: hypothetical protein CBARDCOR_2219 [uncultured Caballeronia sp.]
MVGLSEGALLGVAYVVTGVQHATLLGMLTAIAAMLPFCTPIVFIGRCGCFCRARWWPQPLSRCSGSWWCSWPSTQ